MKNAFLILALLVGLITLTLTFGQLGRNQSFGNSVDGKPLSFGTSTKTTRLQTTPKSSAAKSAREVKNIERELVKVQKELATVEAELEKIKQFGEASPYKGLVTISKSSGGARATDVSKEYITLKAGTKNNSGVKVSQWSLASAVSGQHIQIGNAAEIIFAGGVNTELPIVLRAGETMYISTGRSPIGSSFKGNKCVGYFTQFQTFTPSLSSSCPDPADEILFYSGDPSIFIDNACMDFVDRLPSCKVYTKQLPITLSFSCQTAIAQEINYNSCIKNHRNDDDFEKREWRIFLKRTTELWREKREIIKLLDENNKVVDIFSY